jgi:hypothetical protein
LIFPKNLRMRLRPISVFVAMSDFAPHPTAGRASCP